MEEETQSNESHKSNSQSGLWNPRICQDYFSKGCSEGDNCSLKHNLFPSDIVCRYFLLYGKCFKGPFCPFLHEIISEKLPECKNQSSNSKCLNPNCKFKHSSDKDIKECIYYNHGFCKMGKFCKFKHQMRQICSFSKERRRCGNEECKKIHVDDLEDRVFEEFIEESFYNKHKNVEKIEYKDIYSLCFRCMQFGHHPAKCSNPDKSTAVRCYKCLTYGHKANNCASQSKSPSI